MTAIDPIPEESRESIADVSRRLLNAAYPDRSSSWIDQQVDLAVQRVSKTRSQPPSGRLPAAERVARGRQALRTRPILAAAAGIGTVAAAVIVAITQRKWFAEAAIDQRGVFSLAAGVLVTLAVTVADRVRALRQKILSCRIRINARFDVDTIDAGDPVTLRRPDATTIKDPGMVVASIENAGRTTIEPADYLAPLRLRFPKRTVETVDITESNPPELQDHIALDPGFKVDQGQILLPKIPLAPRDSFKLVVLLSGTKTGEKYEVGTDGFIRHGRITTRPPHRRFSRTTTVGGMLTALLVGALAVVLLLNTVRPFTKHPEGLVCVPGSLTVEGSSAFGLVATKSAGSYNAYCPDSTVDVYTPGSLDGLAHLRDAPEAARKNSLALSDGRADERIYPSLTPRPLAIIPYVFIVNEKAPIKGLTLDKACDIFTGRVSRWSEITGNPADTAEIIVIGRTDKSGTRRTLENYVLGTPNAPVNQAPATSDSCQDRQPNNKTVLAVVCEEASTGELINKVAEVDYSIGYADLPDVKQASGVRQINLNQRGATLADLLAGYPFWTAEYVYSYGSPKPGSLTAVFVDYLSSPESSSTMTSLGYYTCRGDATDLCSRR